MEVGGPDLAELINKDLGTFPAGTRLGCREYPNRPLSGGEADLSLWGIDFQSAKCAAFRREKATPQGGPTAKSEDTGGRHLDRRGALLNLCPSRCRLAPCAYMNAPHRRPSTSTRPRHTSEESKTRAKPTASKHVTFFLACPALSTHLQRRVHPSLPVADAHTRQPAEARWE
jgi:hypothetical protein